MNFDFILKIFQNFIQETLSKIEIMGPKIITVVIIMIFGTLISYGIYKFTMYVFDKFHIIDIIDKLWLGLEEHTSSIVEQASETNQDSIKKEETKKETKETIKVSEIKKVRFDSIIAKSFSYYVFLLFFRWAVVLLGVTEIEVFMGELLAYLPNLFIGVLIGFFGIRFANSIHDIIYQALEITKQETSKIIAMGGKIIIMFFTLMIMLNYIKIVDEFIINSIFVGFITTLTISFSLAFGLGGREIAREILESFRK